MESAVGAGENRGSGDFQCSVCNQGVGANSIKCMKCRKWVHKRCSDITGRLSVAKEDFTCRKCRGTMPRTSVAGDGEYLEVDGEKYGVVTSFCYLGDTIDSNGGQMQQSQPESSVDGKSLVLASRTPSLKMKGRVFNACVRSCLLYGSET